MIVITLLVCILIFLVCGAMVYSRTRQYEAANHQVAEARALAIAEAGLEDARVKLNKDADFPPMGSEDQLVFSYVEEVRDLDGVTVLGSYEVVVDMRWREAPVQIIRVTSIGISGDMDQPQARSRVTMDLDVAPQLRTDFTQPNPNFFKFFAREGP
jgi:hypothetical protein